MKRVALVAGVRTPFVKAGLEFSNTTAQELGRIATRELIEKSNLDVNTVDEVVFGNVSQPMEATNISRVIALMAGMPQSVSAQTVARNCASGLQAIATGYELIRNGQANVVIAGGTESMSNIPLVFPKAMSNFLGKVWSAKTLPQRLLAFLQFRPHMIKPIVALLEGLKDPFCGLSMGDTAEILAKEFHISREDQDAFALKSHQRAFAATESGRMKEEISPVYLTEKGKVVADDIGPRKNQTLEALSKLKPYFDRRHGTVTVGNSCPITDGACAVLLMSEDKVKSLSLSPLAWIRHYAFAGVDPRRMGLGPVASSTKALRESQLSMKDIGLVEINEAFAAQVLSVCKIFKDNKLGADFGAGPELSEINPDILNVNGGAIALGHPVGTSGARIALTLAIELQKKSIDRGLASLCIGGGQGGAIILENGGLA
ncbi:MAG: thiolase family protein [Bdellovibrionales bacterium]|nr:thiolase family protein [Bdellovibrionales bacterium]